MKKLVLFITLLFSMHCIAYNWTSFGPSNSETLNVCFYFDYLGHHVICTNTGIMINDSAAQGWNTYSYGLPVLEATHFNDISVLLVMGDGSWSDGIWKFNMTNHQFEVMEWCVYPNFLIHCETNNQYYVGYEYGLLTSSDGINWSDVEYFNGKHIAAMDYYDSNLVVSEVYSPKNIYYSNDCGAIWNQNEDVPAIIALNFNNEGTLYAVAYYETITSGLCSSTDFGATWENEFYSEGELKTVEIDAFGNIFVGWINGTFPHNGIAIYDPITGALTSLNYGLPNTNINKIRYNPYITCPTIYCCTHQGVYYCYDYLTGIDIQVTPTSDINLKVYPNPVKSTATVIYNLPFEKNNVSVIIYDSGGKIVKVFNNLENSKGEHSFVFDGTDLQQGIYYCKLLAGNQSQIVKIVLLK